MAYPPDGNPGFEVDVRVRHREPGRPPLRPLTGSARCAVPRRVRDRVARRHEVELPLHTQLEAAGEDVDELDVGRNV